MPPDFFATLDRGDRIVVRYRLGNPPSGSGGESAAPAPPAPRLSDAIGHFLGLEDGVLTLQTRSGTIAIRRIDVTHVKRVPPAPPPRRPRHG